MRPHLNPPLKGEEEIGGTLLCPFPSQGKVRMGSWKRTPPQSSPKRGGRMLTRGGCTAKKDKEYKLEDRLK